MLHIIWYIILGFLAGLIARLIMHVHMDLLLTTLLGIVGSIVGGTDRPAVFQAAGRRSVSSCRPDTVDHRSADRPFRFQ